MSQSLLRVVALWLLILAASPVTAPFATFDLLHAGFGTEGVDVGAKLKEPNPTSILAATPFAALGLAFRTAQSLRPAPVLDTRPFSFLHSILRI